MVGGKDHRRKAPAIGDRQLHVVEDVAFLWAERMAVDAIIGDDGELRRVDRVGALAQHFALRALLAATEQESPRVLKVGFVLGVVGAEHLRGAERRAVAREHIGDLALADRDQIRFVDPVHEREKQMQAAAQHFGLVTRLAVQAR